jgi:hypothetical protein
MATSNEVYIMQQQQTQMLGRGDTGGSAAHFNADDGNRAEKAGTLHAKFAHIATERDDFSDSILETANIVTDGNNAPEPLAKDVDAISMDSLNLGNAPTSIWRSKWVSFILYLIGGTLILASPAIVLIIRHERNQPNLDITKSFADLQALNQFDVSPSVVRWMLWVAATYANGVTWWYFLNILPAIIVFIITRIWGFCSEKQRQKLQYIPSAKFSLWLCACMIITLLLFM